MVEGKKLDAGAFVTAMIDSMVHALVDQMHAEDDERLREEIAFCEAIAETYGQKARLLRSLLKEQPGAT